MARMPNLSPPEATLLYSLSAVDAELVLCRAAEGSSIHLEVQDWREAKGEACNPRLEVATATT